MSEFNRWWGSQQNADADSKEFARRVWQVAVLTEREASAVIAENFSTKDGYEIAHKIRARK